MVHRCGNTVSNRRVTEKKSSLYSVMQTPERRDGLWQRCLTMTFHNCKKNSRFAP